MILIKLIDTDTGKELIGNMQNISVLLPLKSSIVSPVEGQLAYDDDYIYIYVNAKWKRTSITNFNE